MTSAEKSAALKFATDGLGRLGTHFLRKDVEVISLDAGGTSGRVVWLGLKRRFIVRSITFHHAPTRRDYRLAYLPESATYQLTEIPRGGASVEKNRQ